jgi:xylan 1,4-beta-xylosidase
MPMSRIRSVLVSAIIFAASFAAPHAQQAGPGNRANAKHVAIDAYAAPTPFPHYWEQMFGSGRTNLAMRASYRSDMRQVKQITGFRYVRFHEIPVNRAVLKA